MARTEDAQVPSWLRTAASWSWRLLIFAAALVVAGMAFTRLEVVAVPLVAALFLSTLLAPPAHWLRRHGWPPLLATWAVFLLGLAVAAGIVFGLIPVTQSEFATLGKDLSAGLSKAESWLVNGPLHLSRHQLSGYVSQAKQAVSTNRVGLLRGALSGVTVVAELAAGFLLTVVLTFFFVKDSAQLTGWALGLARSEERASQLRSLGSDVWRTLTGYVHGTAFNGFVNAVLLSIALLGLGVPLVLPIALLTFVGGFLPLVGGIVSGLLAALVTLVAKGPLYALIVVGCTVVIHNVEGYLSGPLVLRRAVSLHPVAILLVLAVGSIAGGVIGAFVAVPLTAVIVAFVGHMRRASLVTVHGGEIRASDIRPVGSQGGGDQARGDQARGEQARLEQLEAVRRASGLD